MHFSTHGLHQSSFSSFMELNCKLNSITLLLSYIQVSFFDPPNLRSSMNSPVMMKTYHGVTDQVSQVAFSKPTLLRGAVQEDQSLSHLLGRVVGQTLFPFLHVGEDVGIWWEGMFDLSALML